MDDPDWIIEVREWLKLCKQLAEKAVERGFMTKYHMNFPGFGFVATYAIV